MGVYREGPQDKSHKGIGAGNSSGQSRAVGVVCLEQPTPALPWGLQNGAILNFPMVLRTATGTDLEGLRAGGPELERSLCHAALELERDGAVCVIGNSRYMLPFQRSVAAAVQVPVALSALVQLPMISSFLAPSQSIGVIHSGESVLDVSFLEKYGVGVPNRLVIRGLAESEEMVEELSRETGVGGRPSTHGPLGGDRLEESFYRYGRQLVDDHPDLGAVLLERSEYSTYAHAVQVGAGVPVFDFVTLVDYLHAASRRREARGFALH